jgi:hypothetical protein
MHPQAMMSRSADVLFVSDGFDDGYGWGTYFHPDS